MTSSPPIPIHWPKRLLYVFAFLAVAAAAALMWAHAFRNDRQLAQYVMRQVNPLIRGRIEVDSIHWEWRLLIDLAAGTAHPVTLSNVRIYDPRGELVIGADRVRARIALMALLRGELRVKHVDIEGARVTVAAGTYDRSGRTRVGIAAAFDVVHPGPPSSGRGLIVTVDATDVVGHDAQVRFPSWSVRVRNYRAKGVFQYRGGHVHEEGLLIIGSMQAPRGTLKIGPLQLPLTQIQVDKFDTSRDPVSAAVIVKTKVGPSDVLVTGELLRIFSDPTTYNLQAHARNLQDLVRGLTGQAISGKISYDGRVDGAFAAPTISGHLSGVNWHYQRWHASKVGADFVFDTAKMHINAHHLAGTLAGQRSIGNVTGQAQIRLPEASWAADLKLAAMPIDLPEVSASTQLSGTIGLSGTFRPLLTAAARFDLSAKTTSKQHYLPQLVRAVGRAHLTPQIIDLPSVLIQTEGNSITVHGAVNLTSARVNLRSALNLQRLGDSLTRRKWPDVVRKLTGEISAQGQWPQVVVTGSLASTDVGYDKWRVSRILSEVGLKDGVLQLSRIRLDDTKNNGGTKSVLDGRVEVELFKVGLFKGGAHQGRPLQRLSGQLQWRGADLSTLGIGGFARGKVDLSVVAAGTLTQPQIAVKLRTKSAELMAEKLRAVEVDAQLHRQGIAVSHARIVIARGGELSAAGHLGFDQQTDMKVVLKDIPLQTIPGVAQSPITIAGTVSGTVTAKGNLMAPALDGTLSFNQLLVRSMRLGKGQLVLKSLSNGSTTGNGHPVMLSGYFSGGLFQVQGRCLWTPKPQLDLTVLVNRFPLDQLVEEIRRLGDVRGQVSGKIVLRIDTDVGLRSAYADFSQVRLWMRYKSPTTRTTKMIELRNDYPVVAQYQVPKLVLSRVQLSSSIQGQADSRANFQLLGWLSGTDVDLRLIGRVPLRISEFFLSQYVERLDGAAAADIHMTGSWQQPALEGSLVLHNVQLKLPRFNPVIRFPKAHISMTPTRLELHTLQMIVAAELLRVSGHATLDQLKPKLFQLVVDGAISADLLELVFPQHISRASGVLRVSAVAEGPPDDPQIEGTLSVHKVELAPRGWGRLLVLTDGQLELKKYLLRTASPIRGSFDDGSIQIDGDVRLDRWFPVDIDLRVQANGIPQRQPKVYVAESNFDLRLVGDIDALELSGDVELVDGKYIREFDFVRQAIFQPREYYDEEPPFWQGSPVLENLRLRLNLRSTGQLLVVNQHAKIALGGALSVNGTLVEPRLDGSVRVEHGNLRIPFLRGDYTIESGEINFDDKLEPVQAPALIVAETQFEDANKVNYQIRLQLKGPLDNLRMTLSSVPALDQGQILALLTLGRTTEQFRKEINQGQDRGPGAVGAADAQLKEVSGQFLSALLKDVVKQVTGLDLQRLEIGTESALISLCKDFGSYLKLCGDAERSWIGDSRVGTWFQAQLHDYIQFIGKAERVNTRLELERDSPNRARLELKYRIPIR